MEAQSANNIDQATEGRSCLQSSEWADDYSGWGNDVLYRMCRDAPKHTSIDVVASKLWLIGRSYAAAIERGAEKDYHMERMAWLMIREGLDDELRKVETIDYPDHESLGVVLQVHKFLTDLFAKPVEQGGTGVAKRSLASKYLHFHQPKAFFLYDSISKNKLGQALKGSGFRPHRPAAADVDPDYSEFAQRCIHYRDRVHGAGSGPLLSPRWIDMQLQSYERRRSAYMAAFRSNKAKSTHKLSIPE